MSTFSERVGANWIGICLFLTLVLGVDPMSPSLARQWNETPQSKAREYLQIVDQRSAKELVVVLWLAPQLVPPGPTAAQTKRVLEDFTVIGLIHADINDNGSMNFRKISNLNLKPFHGGLEAPISRGALPPLAAGAIVAIEQVFSQDLGNLGKGTSWFVFGGKWNDSCGKGGFWVQYAGTDYDYTMPMPGC